MPASILQQVARGLADARPPESGTFAHELATKLQTEAQYFATHRVAEAHAWARATPAGLARAYLFVGESGEKVLDVGGQSAEEKALGFAFFDPERPDAAADDGYCERPDLTHVGEGCAAKSARDLPLHRRHGRAAQAVVEGMVIVRTRTASRRSSY